MGLDYIFAESDQHLTCMNTCIKFHYIYFKVIYFDTQSLLLAILPQTRKKTSGDHSYTFVLTSNAPFTLQAVYPAVKSFSR